VDVFRRLVFLAVDFLVEDFFAVVFFGLDFDFLDVSFSGIAITAPATVSTTPPTVSTAFLTGPFFDVLLLFVLVCFFVAISFSFRDLLMDFFLLRERSSFVLNIPSYCTCIDSTPAPFKSTLIL
jgi:hypothetical protein